jgi:exonuclease VII small subunit
LSSASNSEVQQLLESALERLNLARARLSDLIARRGPDGLGEVLGDVNKAISDLEEALKLLRRGSWASGS